MKAKVNAERRTSVAIEAILVGTVRLGQSHSQCKE